MSLPRFYLDSLPSSGLVGLSPDDSRHAQSVLRLKVGDTVQLFDGKGFEAGGAIVGMGRAAVQINITSAQAVSRELCNPLELIVALPKGDRQKQLVDLLVQLGVDQLTPLECERAVAQPTDNALERLQRAVIESSKQCGRNQLMKINSPTSITRLSQDNEQSTVSATVRLPSALPPECHTPNDSMITRKQLKIFAHPYGPCSSLIEHFNAVQEGSHSRQEVIAQSVCGQAVCGQAVIGPEGGLTDSECGQLAQSDWTQVSLGKRILRIETAAVMIAATWAAMSCLFIQSSPNARKSLTDS